MQDDIYTIYRVELECERCREIHYKNFRDLHKAQAYVKKFTQSGVSPPVICRRCSSQKNLVI